MNLLQVGLDCWFADSPEARRECASLAGKTVAVELSDLGVSFLLRPGEDGLRVEERGDAEADAVIRGSSLDLLRLSRAEGAHGATGRIDIRGDAELGRRFREILRMARPDPEERLAQAIGDVPAHELGRLFRGIAAFGEDAMTRLGGMLSEYLHYESRDLPTRHEVDEFINGVDDVRDAVERAEARMKNVGATLGVVKPS